MTEAVSSSRPDAGPTSATVLIGRYTPPDGTDGVQRFVLDAGSSHRDATLDLLSPSWMIRAEGLVFAACESSDTGIAALRETESGLELLSTIHTDGKDACHLAASPDGRWLAVAQYTSGSVRLVALPTDGQLEGCLRDLLVLQGSGPVPDRQEMPHAHQVTWLDERQLLCNDLGTDQIRVLRVSDEGRLELLDPIRLPTGFGPRHLVLRGRHLAVCGELSGDIASFVHESDRWDAGWRQVDLVRSTNRAETSQPSGLVPLGDDLVVGNRGIDTIARFTWDAEGRLTWRAESSCGGAMPRDVAVHDGQVWVALQQGNAVVVFDVTDAGFVEVTRFPVEGAARVLF